MTLGYQVLSPHGFGCVINKLSRYCSALKAQVLGHAEAGAELAICV